ncbi:protein-disulfide reductase DsbD family protein [Serpentinimonas barnesii]|uniref:protein-disulfide reductase DsbD family protein n=1 Tax=Serpentinimonas barnesii TaxID=1458427 RepID=UPI0009E41EE6|nr:protein-disulfide reductase DsbD domain-containing protein [Serpentinimonas barnesii]
MFKIFWVFLLGAYLGLGAPLAGAQVSEPVLTPESRTSLLVHAPQGVAPGQPLWLGLQIEHAPGWHSYWKNPGDSGLPTEFEWQLPGHVVPGSIEWPTPRKFPLGELANYGYKDTVLLPIPLEVRPGFAAAALELEVLATWLICRQECIPQEARFQVRIPAQMATVAHAAAFEAAWAARPQPLVAGASQLAVREQALQATLHGLPAAWQGRALEFFPEIGALIQPGAAWQQRWEGGVWHASIPLNPYRSASPEQLALVLALADPPPGAAGVRLELPVPGGWPAVAAPTGVSDALAAALAAEAARATAPAPGLTLWAALLGALIGGMILNLMPCVFPVLALKVLSFSQHAEDRRRLRLGGLAYTAGVVLSFLALGALLLGLRAAGEQLGWGFQLQNPAVVAALAALFTLIGLNLAGLFQFGPMLPSALASLRVRNPNADSFLTGVLATAVASPCTAPFMGAALGLAVTLAPAQALAVFAALGLGMALPYLAATWVPALVRALPRPGAWMETLRQWLAFPMLATVVWLLWVLGHQGGVDAAAGLLMLLLLLAWMLWAVGRGGLMRRWMAPLALLALLGGLWLLGPMLQAQAAGQQPSAALNTPSAVAGAQWEAWSPQREAELLAQGRAVFVDYTAAWCVSCLYNKHNALADESFLLDVAARNVALLRADWTLRDPAVTASLARLGRNSIPVYVLHAPGRAPLLLSEILSVEELRAALAQL